MFKKISKPTDDYSAEWPAYWAQNQCLHRGVGADAADDDKGEKETPAIDPAQFAALQESLAKQQKVLESLEANNKSLLQEKLEAKKATDKAIEEAAKKNGDVEALEKSWSEKLANETKERDAKLTEYQQMINKMTVGSQAQKLASELAVQGSADVLLPHIERRLSVEMKDGQAIVRVLDKDGKPSALSVDDLKKEIEGNAAFAPLIVGSKASGSGSAGGKGSASNKTMKRADFDALNAVDKMKFIRDEKGTIID